MVKYFDKDVVKKKRYNMSLQGQFGIIGISANVCLSLSIHFTTKTHFC